MTAFFRDEALEQKVVAIGVDRRDPKEETYGGIRGRAVALTEKIVVSTMMPVKSDGLAAPKRVATRLS